MRSALYIVCGVAFCLVVYAALFVRIYRVEGPSMEPTLSSNQYVVVDTVWWKWGGLHKGDIAVFVEPTKGQVDIKRVEGLPGETVHWGATQYTDGAGQYFFVGDNIAQSNDSRTFGPVDASAIVGRVLLTLGGR